MSRYGGERIKRGLTYFILGKGMSALASMLAMLLVVRVLSVGNFAAYTVLIALVDTITIVSGLGIAQALVRYVPVLYAKHLRHSLKTLILQLLGFRTFFLLFVVGLIYFFASFLASYIGLANYVSIVKLFLMVILLRSSVFFVSQILESTLHQGIVQIGFSVAAVIRLIGMVFLLYQGDVHLNQVILVEIIGEFFSLMVMLYGLLYFVLIEKISDLSIEDNGQWLAENKQVVTHFSISAYLQHLALLPYGGNTNRIVGGSFLSVSALATYGFSFALYDYIKRYLPTYLLSGLIRPVIFARYSERHDFSIARTMCNHVMQINFMVIAGIFAMLCIGGQDILLSISAGKYGLQSLILLFAMLSVLLLETHRQQLDLLVQLVEKNHFLISSNLLLSSSVLIAIALLPTLGAVAFPMANLIGLLFANYWVNKRLKSINYEFKNDWFSTARTAGISLIAIAVGWFAKLYLLPWFWAVILVFAVYTMLTYLLCKNYITVFLNDITAKHNPLPTIDSPTYYTKPKIAFGVLSSKQSQKAIDNIANIVSPHPVYVHHDFTKHPNFSCTANNVIVLSNPTKTAWGDWSLVEATYLLMEDALKDNSVTHFQLLSEACLPIKSIAAFEHYLLSLQPDAMIDLISLNDSDARNSHGWRYFSSNKLVKKLTRRITILMWTSQKKFKPSHSVNLTLAQQNGSIYQACIFKLGSLYLELMSRISKESLKVQGLNELAIGGQWFCVNRRIMSWLIHARNQHVTLTSHYQKCPIPDESYVHTLIKNATLSGAKLTVYPSNHILFWHCNGTGPDMLIEKDCNALLNTDKFFARKFSLDSNDVVRKKLLDTIKQ
jgi:O-antigen/teichoic acid export membrane protein